MHSWAAFYKRLTTYDQNIEFCKSYIDQYFNCIILKYNYRIENSCKLLVLYQFYSLKRVP